MNKRTNRTRDFKAEMTAVMENRDPSAGPAKLNDDFRRRIVDVYAGNSEGTIATLRPDGWPQANVVDFWYIGLTLYFGSFGTSQKAVNISHDPRVSLTITPPFDDFGQMTGISMAAHAERVTDQSEIGDMYYLFLERVPHMKQFVRYEGDKVYPADGMAVFSIRPKIISLIDFTKGYGHIDVIEIGPENKQYERSLS